MGQNGLAQVVSQEAEAVRDNSSIVNLAVQKDGTTICSNISEILSIYYYIKTFDITFDV